MKVRFHLEESKDWMESLAKQLGASYENDIIPVPDHLGQGFIKAVYFSNKLSVNYMHAYFYEEFIAHREASKKLIPFSPLHFYMHDRQVHQEISGQRDIVGLSTARGIFWPSGTIETKWEFPAHQWLSNFVINLDHEFLLSLSDKDNNQNLRYFLNTKKSFYIFEHITAEMQLILKELVFLLREEHSSVSTKLIIEGNTDKLLGLFMKQIELRQQKGEAMEVGQKDVERLFLLKAALLKKPEETPSVHELARRFGFSERRLHKLFKQVFGRSLYQYALYERMLIAQKMLVEDNLSVSEVGYQLGYTNLSHFTKAFRNQFGINPRDFKKSV